MSPSPPRVLTPTLQLSNLLALFSRLNPDIDPQRIDWDITGKGPFDPLATYHENVYNMERAFPAYTWFETDQDRAETKEQMIAEYADFLDYLLGLAVVPEAKEEMKSVLEKALSDYRYRTERNLEKTTLRKTIKKLEGQLLDAKRTGEPITEIIEKEKTKIRLETERPKIRMTKELERKLRDTFEVTFTRAGISPKRFLPEYRLELDVIKTLTKEDDMIKAVESLARELVAEERARKFKPPKVRPPTEPRPPAERIIGLPPEDEDEEPPFFAVPPVELPAYPEKPFKTALYPNRLLTATEIDDIWDAYRMAVTMCGKNPDHYTKDFKDWMETYLFTNWEQVKTNYSNLIESICKEKKITPIPRAPPAEVIDELVHWITSVNTIEDIIDNKTIKRKPETIDEVIDKLAEMGKMGVPRSDVIAAIKRGWEDKAPNYIIITKEYLETLIGEPLE